MMSESLKRLAALAPAGGDGQAGGEKSAGAGPPARAPGPGAGRFKESTLGPVKVDAYLDAHGIAYKVKQKGHQTLYLLEHCLFNPDHADGHASIIVSPTGPVIYQCFHASCKGKVWKDARQAISGDKPIAQWCAGYDPNWKPPRTVGTGMMTEIEVATPLPFEADSARVPHPEQMDPMEMFEKRGKRPVFVPMYMTRYLAAYLGPLIHTSGTYWRYSDGLWKPFPETSLIQYIVAVMKDRCQSDMLKNTLNMLNGLINREEEKWPNDVNLLCLKNGMLDLKTMRVIPHHHKYGARVQLPVNYNHEKPAWSERWWKFLQEIFPDDENYEKRGLLQQYFGYCLLRDSRHQVMLLEYGTGANGKSTTLECLQAAVGFENTSSIPLEEIGERFKGQYLQNKLVNISGEINQRKPLETDFLKKVIGGDPITVEAKYGEHFQFKPFVKFICGLNEAPVIPDKTYGFARRIIVINFERRFSPAEIAAKAEEIGGRKMSEYLIEEIDGIFAWMLDGLKVLLKNYGFRIPDKVQMETEQMMEALNPLLIFVNEMCEVHEKAMVPTTELYECYEEWCRAGNNRVLGRNKFLEQIRATFRITRPRTTEGRKEAVDGIGLTQTAQDWCAERKARFTRRSRED